VGLVKGLLDQFLAKRELGVQRMPGTRHSSHARIARNTWYSGVRFEALMLRLTARAVQAISSAARANLPSPPAA